MSVRRFESGVLRRILLGPVQAGDATYGGLSGGVEGQAAAVGVAVVGAKGMEVGRE
jgi:hypothetical protein